MKRKKKHIKTKPKSKTMNQTATINMYQYNEFYRNNKRSLLNFIYKMTHDSMASEELVNDVFIKVYHAMHTFDESKASFKTWVYNIATNATIDFLRKKKLNTLSLYGALQGDDSDRVTFIDIESGDENPLESLITTDSKEKMKGLLSHLNETQATMMTHMINGLNYQEIADELDLPIGTVKSYIHQARIRMKSFFGKTQVTA